MSSQRGRNRRGSLAVSVGWVFADLLLALAMIFLVANTKATPVIPTPTPMPTPSPTFSPTPTPTPNALLLDRDRVRLTLTTNNPVGLSNGDPATMANLAQEIRMQITQLGLQGRRAGIAIAYGGADNNTNEIPTAQSIAGKVYTVLDTLGGQKFVFCKTVHYDALFVLDNSSTTIVIDIYMFNKSVGGCNNIS